MSSKPTLGGVPSGQPHHRKWHRKLHKWILGALLLALLAIALNSTISRIYDYWDVGSNSWFSKFSGGDWQFQRGAAVLGYANQFGDQYTSIRYLSQGWKPAESMWYYTTTQGSDLIPYDFFLSLELPDTGKPFRSNENLYFYGYLPQLATRNNPDALPIGFVKDEYQGKEYVGFACAACHTGQLNYKGVGIRIDGGPAGSDMDSMLQKLSETMYRTQENATARAAFVKRVMARGKYKSEKDVLADLEKYSRRLTMYIAVNRSPTRYGYFRLDAFGRIYNRVLEHVLTQDQLRATMQNMVREGDLTQAELDSILNQKGDNVLTGDRRDHLVLRLMQVLPVKAQLKLAEKLFNTPNAPVSYPYLWDVPQHDYVQWNGLAPNAGLGSVGRNTGEVVGVFATLDWSQKRGLSLSALLNGQGLKPEHIDFKSSVNVHNLRRLEHQLESLKSPQWPEDILPAINRERAERGAVLFGKDCASCHTNINRDDPQRRVVANITGLKSIGTDPQMAVNAAKYEGLSGILRNSYTVSGGGPVLISERAPVAAMLGKAVLSVVATPSPDKNFIHRGLDWADDLVTAFLSNDIKPSIRQGNYDPDTSANPYASLLSYKARSLNGIWATAPYLHNGSVPTLYDLLLPKRKPTDPAAGEYRPDKFVVGSREFDPEKVGLRSDGYAGFEFNTNLQGNSNAGHEYRTRELSREDRLDLLEYLKTL